MIDEFFFMLKLDVVKKLVQSGKTLDVGCGDKIFTMHLPDAIGIDKYHECDHIKTRPDFWMDACDLKFPDNTFDNVCFFDVLEHIPDVEKAISEARRVLKHNGVVAIVDPSDAGLFWFRLLALRWRQAFRGRKTPRRESEDSPGHIHKFSKRDVVDFMSPHFKLEKVMHRIIFTGYRFRRVDVW